MNNILIILQIIISVILTILILMQARGTGFGRGSFGASGFTRRGLEKLVFRLTFVMAFLFLTVSTLRIVL
mgnify:CR=1 FL=1